MTDTEILAAIEAGSQFAIRRLSRLDVASRIAAGLCAKHGYPWDKSNGSTTWQEDNAEFAQDVFEIADALIAENETKRCSPEEIHAAIVESANEVHEGQ